MVSLDEKRQSITLLLAEDSAFLMSSHATSFRFGMWTDMSRAFVVSPPMLNTCSPNHKLGMILLQAWHVNRHVKGIDGVPFDAERL